MLCPRLYDAFFKKERKFQTLCLVFFVNSVFKVKYLGKFWTDQAFCVKVCLHVCVCVCERERERERKRGRGRGREMETKKGREKEIGSQT
jgi:hypothetical protein